MLKVSVLKVSVALISVQGSVCLQFVAAKNSTSEVIEGFGQNMRCIARMFEQHATGHDTQFTITTIGLSIFIISGRTKACMKSYPIHRIQWRDPQPVSVLCRASRRLGAAAYYLLKMLFCSQQIWMPNLLAVSIIVRQSCCMSHSN